MSDSKQRIARLPEAMPISRLLRLALGAVLVVAIARPYLSASWRHWLELGGVFVALVAIYTVVHVVVARHLGSVHPWVGAAIACVPVVVIFLMGGVYQDGVVAFIGLSLVLIAALGHPGCEVLAFPALILGRRTHLACLLFSPLDWIEGKLTG